MKPKDIRRAVRVFFVSATMETAYSGPILGEAMNAGRQQDGDAVLLVTFAGTRLACALMVGRSALYGEEAMGYLLEYFEGDRQRVDAWIEKVAKDASDFLKRSEGAFFGMLRDTDERWRGFRGTKPMTVDEVRQLAQVGLN